jgi:HEAT repeat protein
VRGAAVRAVQQSAGAEDVVGLIETLRRDHQDPNVLSSALQALIGAAVDVVPAFVELLRHPAANLRMHAAQALGDLNDGAATAPLIEALQDDNANVRFHAVEALGRLRAAEALEPLSRLAASGDFFLAFAAIDALGRIHDPAVLPVLLPLLDQELLRPAVIDALGSLADADAVIPLAERLNAGDAEPHAVAAALDRIHRRHDAGGARTHVIETARRSISPTGVARLTDAVARRQRPLSPLVSVLGWMGPSTLSPLLGVLGDAEAQADAGDAIVALGAAAVAPVIEYLQAGDRDARLAATAVLGRLGDRRAVPPLIQLLTSADDELVIAAADALAQLADGRALDPLLTLFSATSAAVRQAAIGAVNATAADGTEARILARLSDANQRVRECAVRVAAASSFTVSTAGIVGALADEHEDVRRAAIEGLRAVDEAVAVPRLLAALHEETPRNRAAAAHVLRAVDGAVEAPLVAALDDADAWVRYFAADSLALHGGAAALAALGRTINSDPAPHVRIAAMKTLAALDAAAASRVASAHVASADDDLACAALGAMAFSADGAADELLARALDDTRSAVFAAAAQALAVRGGTRASEILASAAQTAAGGEFAVAAIDGLREVAARPTDAGQADALRALLDLGTDRRWRDRIGEALDRLPAHVIDQLGAALDGPPGGVRRLAVESLARRREARASDVLTRVLSDEDEAIRSAALAAVRRRDRGAATTRSPE